jgi:hypothetical protein
MNKLIVLSIIQGLYIVYILNFFKTKYSLAHPLSTFSNDYLKHPIGINNEPISNICEFGHQVSWFLGLFVILRSIFKNKFTKHISLIVLIITATFSMLNLNAVIYLFPHFIIEIYLIKNNFNL